MSWASRHLAGGGYTQRGARIGAAFGPIGLGLGALIGNLWGRHQTAQANAGMDAISAGTTAALNNAIWGNGWNAQPGTGVPLLSAQPDDPYAVTNTDSPVLAELGITQWGDGAGSGGGGGMVGGGGGGVGSWSGGGFGLGGSGSYSGGTGAGAAGVASKFASNQYFDID